MRTTAKQRYEVINRLQAAGISYEHANALRRISMTLSRWGELECGDGNDYTSWGIERDEATGKPYMVYHPHNGPSRRRPVADREQGALKRLQAIAGHCSPLPRVCGLSPDRPTWLCGVFGA